ncbi:MAG TPA: ankyrin repeat domain-containing protein [Planctomycetaceae bacterium]|nr:ankyrin repeat domain-containing protein [Planctomycetaceae bacterium]
MKYHLAVVLSSLLAIAPSQAQDLLEPVRNGDIEQVKKLLASGADVNESYENRITPIFVANTPEMVKLLLASGAELEVRSAATGQSPIENAAENFYERKNERAKWKRIVAILRNGGATYTVDTAIYLNDIDFIKARLASDDSWVNYTEGSHSAPLRVAARIGRTEICKLLLEHRADPDSFASAVGFPIIHDAVDHPAIVKLLIEHGANLKRRITWLGGRTGIWIVGDEATALHFAVRAGNLESVKLLVEAGLDPSAADDKGQTPLHIAILFERWERDWKRDASSYPAIVEYLLEHDASIRFEDKSGRSPLKLARKLKSSFAIRSALRRKRLELSTERSEWLRRSDP